MISIWNFFKSCGKQAILLVIMLITPIIWSSYINSIEPSSINLLISFGCLLVIEGYSYVQLPVDIIPDFIPIIGKMDDGLAYFIITIGSWSILIGIAIFLYPYLSNEIFSTFMGGGLIN